jgi:mannose/fructose/N-acetylgalactosamine-specific phosphotransferase system component IID
MIQKSTTLNGKLSQMEFRQGSTLGPLLFLLYVNNIPNVISDTSNPILYADDTSLILNNSDSQVFEKYISTAILQLNGLRVICYY